MMSKEAMKLALEALEHCKDVIVERGLNGSPEFAKKWGLALPLERSEKAITALREALAEQPYEIGTRLAREGKGISDLWGAVKSDADMAEAQRGYEAALAEQPAQRPQNCGTGYCSCIECLFEQQEPVAWPCVIAEADFSENTVTLAMQCTDYKVSASKHWLYTSPPAQRTWVGLDDEEIQTTWSSVMDGAVFTRREVYKAIEAKLRSKNNG